MKILKKANAVVLKSNFDSKLKYRKNEKIQIRKFILGELELSKKITNSSHATLASYYSARSKVESVSTMGKANEVELSTTFKLNELFGKMELKNFINFDRIVFKDNVSIYSNQNMISTFPFEDCKKYDYPVNVRIDMVGNTVINSSIKIVVDKYTMDYNGYKLRSKISHESPTYFDISKISIDKNNSNRNYNIAYYMVENKWKIRICIRIGESNEIDFECEDLDIPLEVFFNHVEKFIRKMDECVETNIIDASKLGESFLCGYLDAPATNVFAVIGESLMNGKESIPVTSTLNKLFNINDFTNVSDQIINCDDEFAEN